MFAVYLQSLSYLWSLVLPPVDVRLVGSFAFTIVMQSVNCRSLFRKVIPMALLCCWYCWYYLRLLLLALCICFVHIVLLFVRLPTLVFRSKVGRLFVLTRSSTHSNMILLLVLCGVLRCAVLQMSLKLQAFLASEIFLPCCFMSTRVIRLYCYVAGLTPWYTSFSNFTAYCFCSWFCQACFAVVPFRYSSLRFLSSSALPWTLLSLFHYVILLNVDQIRRCFLFCFISSLIVFARLCEILDQFDALFSRDWSMGVSLPPSQSRKSESGCFCPSHCCQLFVVFFVGFRWFVMSVLVSVCSVRQSYCQSPFFGGQCGSPYCCRLSPHSRLVLTVLVCRVRHLLPCYVYGLF